MGLGVCAPQAFLLGVRGGRGREDSGIAELLNAEPTTPKLGGADARIVASPQAHGVDVDAEFGS
jgi:hypothetical protein